MLVGGGHVEHDGLLRAEAHGAALGRAGEQQAVDRAVESGRQAQCPDLGEPGAAAGAHGPTKLGVGVHQGDLATTHGGGCSGGQTGRSAADNQDFDGRRRVIHGPIIGTLRTRADEVRRGRGVAQYLTWC